jgi:sigma-B regulation protein RsbU (phosphoserine phosphatase)
VVAIENKKLFKSKLEQEVMKKELELAAQMQSMLIPKDFPEDPRLDVSGVYLPHRDIGGDYYDFTQLGDNRFAVCMGDISGKGVAAGLLMSNFQANLRMVITKEYRLDELVHLLNIKVAEITKGEKYITFFIGIMDFERRKLQFVNAGHNPAILVTTSGIELLKRGSTFLGMFDELPFVNVGEVEVEPDSLLFTYTDGLTDLRNPEGEMFEDERLEEFVQRNAHLGPDEFNEYLLKVINDYKQDEQYVDDVSLLTCRFH